MPEHNLTNNLNNLLKLIAMNKFNLNNLLKLNKIVMNKFIFT